MAAALSVRLGTVGLTLGGATWLLLGVLAATGTLQAIPGREDVVLFAVALVLTAAGLIGLHALQEDGVGLLGRAGLYVSLAAITARLLGAVVFLAGSTALEWISSPGVLGMVVGFALYGAATLRAGVLPRWCGAALIVAIPVSLPLSVYGTSLFGLVLLALGLALLPRRDAAAVGSQSSRVR